MTTFTEIEDYLFKELKAINKPDYNAAKQNLNNTDDDWLEYIGTYHPRSFCESKWIFNDLFENQIIQSSINQKHEYNILDIGSGTGGNAAFKKRGPSTNYFEHDDGCPTQHFLGKTGYRSVLFGC